MFEESIRDKNFLKDIPFVTGFTSEEGLVSKKERERGREWEREGQCGSEWEREGESGRESGRGIGQEIQSDVI